MTVDFDQDLARALLTGLLHDSTILARGIAVPDALDRHRADRRAWYGDLVGPLSCPTSRVPELVDALGKAAGADPVEVVLVADSGELGVEQAKNLLLDEDGTDLAGVRLALPLGGDPAVFASRVLDALTFAVPATIEVPPVPGWEGALDVLAADGAERVAFRTDDISPDLLAAQLLAAGTRRLPVVLGSDLRRAVRGVHSEPRGPGVLHVLAAAAAVVDGASVEDVRALLVAPDLAACLGPLTSVSPGRIRGLLTAVTSSDVRAVVAELVATGLLSLSD